MSRNPRILVYSAGHHDATALIEAATRAGALGVLDLSWLDSAGLLDAQAAVRRVARRFDAPFAVRVDARVMTEAWLASLPPTASPVIAVGSSVEGGEVPSALTLIQAAGRIAWAEVISCAAATIAEAAGATGLIVVGQEAGGWIGHDSSFLLLQAVVAHSELPVWVRGGVGLQGAADCVAAGAAGVVLDGAALLAREANPSTVDREQIARWDGGATRVLRLPDGRRVRVVASPRSAHLVAESEANPLNWDALQAQIGWQAGQVWPAGQDAALAEELSRTSPTIGELVRATAEAITESSRAAGASNPLEPTCPRARPADIAIVGMAAILPGAGDVRTFWDNTLRRHDAITEVPADRWDWRLYYDADPKAPDKVVSKWGGFVPDVAFDPLRYGMPPTSLPSIEPVQLLLLEATRAAITDAGYADRPFARERTAVVLGMGGGAAQLAMGYAFRSYLPMLDAVSPGSGQATLDACQGLLPEWTEDSFPGFLLNVAAGRVANRFDLGGANYTVDAACGSSLAAAALAVRELESGSADVVLLGGADTVQNPFTYLAFSKTHAFSPRGRCRPFDASADGIVISEGVAMVVLKRRADAERDGDRIYAVIKGLGASSDGRARGLTAPNPAGQVRAVERAYAQAGVEPRTIGYVEAHGTGTAVGDVVEVNAIAGVFRERGVPAGSVAIGSVKSMIGHTKCAAGLAGLINASLALHHRVFPPTIGVETVNPSADLADGPFRVNTAARPWLHSDPTHPRRAGVSAFGFGGTNFHVVLEAYDTNITPAVAASRAWPAELFVWRGLNQPGLLAAIDTLIRAIAAGARPMLRDLARAVNEKSPAPAAGSAPTPTLAIVAGSLDDLDARLKLARATIQAGAADLDDPRGVFYRAVPEFGGAAIGFVFPGQGSQAPGMLADLAIAFPAIREAVEAFDRALSAAGEPGIGPFVFPPPGTDEVGRSQVATALAATDQAQPALGAVSVGLLRLLGSLGIEADLLAGHSFGELVALHAAGSIGVAALARLARERGRLMLGALGDEPGTMAAVAAGIADVAPRLGSFRGVTAVNENGPEQTVIAGPRAELLAAIQSLTAAGFRVKPLAVAGAFHTALIAGVRAPLARAARRAIEASPDRPVYSNLDARPHPAGIDAIAERVGEHAVRPVRWAASIEAMYRDGARVFVEVGPGSVLTPLVGSILGDRPHLAVACDSASKPGIATFLVTLARLAVAGVPLGLDRLNAGRSDRVLDLDHLLPGDGLPLPSPTTWLVNGTRSRPLGQAEPKRLGQSAERLGRGRPAQPPSVMVHSNGNQVNGTGSGRYNGPKPPLNGNGSRPPDSPSNGKVMNSIHPTERSSSPPLPLPSVARGTSEERVLASFQDTMRVFLDVQRETMLAYLGGRSNPSPVAPPSAPAALANSAPNSVVVPPSISDRMTARPELVAAPVARPAVIPPSAPMPAAPQPVAVEPAAAAEVIVPMGRDAVAGRLIEIVRDRTGYPAEMLGLELDLEADLGIDSIKRVEILGSLRDSVAALAAATDVATMDSLSRARTLGAIVDRVDEIARRQAARETPVSHGNGRSREAHPAATVAAPMQAEADSDPEPGPVAVESTVRRFLIEAVPAPLASFGARGGLASGGVVVVTDDGRGVGRVLASRFEAEGHPVVLAGLSKFDLGSPSSVDLLLARARASGPIAAIVHAAPLRGCDEAGLDPARWAARMVPEVRGLFLLAKGAANDLDRAAKRGGSALIAATAMGGTFGSTGAGADFFPGHGGVAGLMKTLAREWPGVRARVVDLDPRDPTRNLAERLLDETLIDDGWSEVGYQAGQRVRLQTQPARLDRTAAPRLELEPGQPVVVTGGARGITAAVALELARAWRPTLLLIGRSPLPPEEEDSTTAGIAASTDLKAALLAQLRRTNPGVTPADLDRADQAVRQGREIRANLAAIRAAGATVAYARADVRDPASLATVLDGWRRQFGDPAGLIHGAGVIQDKLIRDKTLTSFDAVLGTKLDGALNLARLLNPEALRFAALFSSIAGRFGNAGQSDYAAANEVLNKLALWLDRRWPGRVVALNWGPWSGVGMVADLEGHLGARGLGMITPEVGRGLLLDELRFGSKGKVEVVAAGDLGNLAAPVEIVRPSTERNGSRSAGAVR